MTATTAKVKSEDKSMQWDLDSIFLGGSGSVEFEKFRSDLRRDLDKAKYDLKAMPQSLEGDDTARWIEMILEIQRLGEHADLVYSFATCLVSQDVTDERGHTINAETDVMVADWYSLLIAVEAFALKQSDTDWTRFVSSEELKEISFTLTELRTKAKEKMAPELEDLAQELSVNGYHAWGKLYGRISGEIRVPYQENGKSKEISIGQLSNKLLDPDRSVRKEAFEKLETAWEAKASLAAAALNSQAGFRLSIYRRRNWDSIIHEPLNLNRIRETSLEAMWAAIAKALPKLNRYIEAKKRFLGIDKFRWYDQMAPVGDAGKSFAYKEAGDFIVRHLGSFSDDMAKFARMALDKRWVEAENRSGKRDGGFCTGMDLKRESRIFMTYSDDFGSMTTLAHELGHAYHQWALKDTPFMASMYPLGLAESASIFSELTVTDAALNEVALPEQKLMLLDQILQQPFILFCNITARYLFDRSFYAERAKGVVERQTLDQLMVAAQKKAFGTIFTSDDAYHPLFWASKLHFYITEAPFYNFPYTIGFLFATGIYARAVEEGKAFAPKYTALLADTGKMTTENVAQKHLGADLSEPDFWENAVRKSISHVDQFVALVDQLA